MSHYSAFTILKNALSGHKNWPPVWRFPDPKPRYDVVIVGGGGHGLATAYYLAKLHGVRNVAVVEKGWLGGGNTGRNTTIVRSNYMLDANGPFYEKSLQLWEGLSADLNYNVMFSQRGVLNLAHSDTQMDAYARRGNSMRLRGVDAELLDRKQVQRFAPEIETNHNRFPVYGGLLQPRGGTARHDAIAWGLARGADSLGVDILQNTEVTGIDVQNGKAVAVETTRGRIEAGAIGLAVAGNTSRLAQMADIELPIESHVLQAFVTEPLKPLINTVCTYGSGHLYVSQSDKGGLVYGGDLDGYNSYAQRGNLPLIEHVHELLLAVLPAAGRVRMLRHWGGVMDMTMDGSPIIGTTPVENLYLNGGWCYGGFKATPGSGWVFAHTIATGAPHELNAGLSLDRFEKGYTADEGGKGPTPGYH